MPTTADETSTCIDYLARVMKAPWIRDTARAPAERSITGAWTGPQHPRAVLEAEVAARETSGAKQRLRAAGFPAVKTLEESNSDHQPALLPLGRGLRRPSRRLRHDRPHHPPRRSHHPQGRVPQAPEHHHDHPASHPHRATGRLDTNKPAASLSSHRKRSPFSTAVDNIFASRSPSP